MQSKIKFNHTSFLILIKDNEFFSKKLIKHINSQNVKAEFIIADGSKNKQKKIFDKLIPKKKYYYFGEDNNITTFLQKTYKGINKCSKKFIFFCDQDDLINFKTIKKKEKFLLVNKDYSAAKGTLYDFNYINKKIYIFNKTYSNFVDSKFFLLRQIFNINFRSYYCLHRRKNLIKFFRLITKYKLNDFRSSEFIMDLCTISAGRIKFFKDTSVLRWSGIKNKNKKHPLNTLHTNRYNWFKYFFSSQRILIRDILNNQKIFFNNFYIFKIHFFISDILGSIIKKNAGYMLLIRIINKINRVLVYDDQVKIYKKFKLDLIINQKDLSQ